MLPIAGLLLLGFSSSTQSSALHARSFALALSAQDPASPRTFASADERYKADILVVVAHPDDEGAVTPYLARALDEGKRVAVVYGTRGGSGANQAGAEHAAALADIREIEARRACASLGVSNVWFLGGKDTASQNVLQSLASWGHGAALEEMVRLVRLTRPEVILTFFPGVFIGENHGDHQAAGVLATEAFDLAGDSAVFSSQVAGPTRRLEPFLENLRPWQPKKIYYFDGGGSGSFKDSGPSVLRHGNFEVASSALLACCAGIFSGARNTGKKIHRFARSDERARAGKASYRRVGFGADVHFRQVIGRRKHYWRYIRKHLRFARSSCSADTFIDQTMAKEISIELGGPWSFYRDFRLAHGLERLPKLDVPEIAVAAGGVLEIPIWLRNSTNATQEIKLTVAVPNGWTVKNGADTYSVRPGEDDPATIEIAVPQLPASETKSKEISEVLVRCGVERSEHRHYKAARAIARPRPTAVKRALVVGECCPATD